MHLFRSLFFLLCIIFPDIFVNSYVIELDSEFVNNTNAGPWLVKFYAPWCGHCQKLEPIYERVAKRLAEMQSNVKIARVDVTRFPEMANIFEIYGYPTIKFIDGNKVFAFEDVRSEQHLVDFVQRATSANIKSLASIGHFRDAMEKHRDSVFFVLVSQNESSSRLGAAFQQVAEAHRFRAYFYQMNSVSFLDESLSNQIPRHLTASDSSLVLVIKSLRRSGLESLNTVRVEHFADKSSLDANSLASNLSLWVVKNRYSIFPKLNNDVEVFYMVDLARKLVLFIVNSTRLHQLKQNCPNGGVCAPTRADRIGQQLRELGVALATEAKHEDLRKSYFFAESEDLNNARYLTLSPSLAMPTLFVFDPINQSFALPTMPILNTISPSDEAEASNQNAEQKKLRENLQKQTLDFLEGVLYGSVTIYGGSTFWERLKRTVYNFFMSLLEFITTSPLIALLIIGLPLSVFSFLCYLLCCLDTADDPVEMHRARKYASETQRKQIVSMPLRSNEQLKIDPPNRPDLEDSDEVEIEDKKTQ